MNFRKTFPVTAWIWRHSTSLRLWRNTALVFSGFVIVTAIGFRIDDALFAARVKRAVYPLANIRVGATAEDELVRMIPALKNADGEAWCRNQHCYSITEEDPHWVDRFWMATESSGWLRTALYYWGFPARRLVVGIRIDSGRVSGLFYNVMLISADPVDVMSPVIFVGAVTSPTLDSYVFQVAADQSPEYSVEFRPRQTFVVQMTPFAPRELAQHPFEIHTSCIWSLRFCRTPEQLLPEVARDWTRIRQASLERLQGPEPCPAKIVTRRIRDGFEIGLLEVVSADPGTRPDWNHEPYREAQMRLIQAFQKRKNSFFDRFETDEFLAHLRIPLEQTEPTISPARVANPALRTLKPGQRYIWFYDSRRRFDSPCELIPATDEVLRALDAALRALPPSDRQTSH